MTAEEGAFHRPFCRVAAATPALSRPDGPRQVRTQQTFTLLAYPKEKKSPDESRMEAARVEGLLFNAFLHGVHTPSFYTPTMRGHGMRVPLYDYDDIDLKHAAEETDRKPNDFLHVSDPPSIGSQVDPEDELMWVVTADIPMWWTRSVAVSSPEVIVQRIDVEGVWNG